MEKDIYYRLGDVLEDGKLELYSSTTASYSLYEQENKLVFKGAHYGATVERISGKDEYEFYYLISQEGYNSLVAALQDKQKEAVPLKELFLKEFGVEDGSYCFLKFCEENQIDVEVHSL